MELEVLCYPLGIWQTNAYALISTVSNLCWIIDPGFDPDTLLTAIDQRGLRVEKIILTHAHVDHIGGLEIVHGKYPDAPIYIHEAEKDFLTDPAFNLSLVWPPVVKAPPADELLKHGDSLTLDGATFEIRHTPGHSPGGITLYQPEQRMAVVGDTLFYQGIGRTDFPTSDGDLLMKSIRDQLMTLPGETTVLPGHGPSTSIEHERYHNPFLNFS